MKKLLFRLFILIYIYIAIRYQYDLIEWCLLLFILVASSKKVKRIKNLQDNIFFLYWIGYLFCSIFVFVLFEMNGVGYFKNNVSFQEHQRLAFWGNHVFFLILCTDSLLNLIKPRRDIRADESMNKDRDVRNNKACEKDFIKITYIIYALCLISIPLGLFDAMQPAKVVLPFHLNGIINESHYNLYPFIFALYVFDCYRRGLPLSKKCVILFAIFLPLEIVVTSSKGVLVVALLPALASVVLCGKFTKKIMLRVCLPLVLLVYLLYPVISLARSDGSTLSFDTLISAYTDSKSIDEDEKSSPFTRAFLSGLYYIKVMDEVDRDPFSFDFRHVPYLVLNRGGATYMTRIIDQVPEDVHHGSGICGLPDAILWGGQMLCFIIIILYTLVAFMGDNSHLFVTKPPFKIILFFFFQTMVANRSITMFVDSWILSTVMTIVIKIIITKYYYKRYA